MFGLVIKAVNLVKPIVGAQQLFDALNNCILLVQTSSY